MSTHVDAPNTTAIEGWAVVGGSIDYIGTRWTAGHGQRCLDLSGVSPGTISQVISNLVPGQTYELSFLLAGNPELIPPLPAVKRLQASIGSVTQEFAFDASGRSVHDLGWTPKTLRFTAEHPSETLTFQSLTGGLGGPALDHVAIVQVPILPAGLVVNGSFELGLDPGISANLFAPDATTIVGWSVDRGSVDYIGTRWSAGDGTRCVDLSGESLGAISQTISNLVPGQSYRLTFLMAGNPESVPPLSSVKRLRASIGSAAAEFSFDVTGRSPQDMGWLPRALDFVAANPVETLTFESLEDSLGGPALDHVSIESIPALLVITTHPQSQAVRVGETAQFSVTATGTEPLSYQWWFEGSALAGQTGSTLTLANVQPAQAGNYWVVVANAAGAVTSQVARLTVEPPPLRRYDLSADFSLAANPNGPWSYGAAPTLHGPLSLFTIRGTTADDRGLPIEYWQLLRLREPTVFHNSNAVNAVAGGGQAVLPPGTVWLMSGTDGVTNGFGVVRFTVPAGEGGPYRVEAAVRPVWDGPTQGDTDFHVVHNGVELFGQFLAPGEATGYTNQLRLAEGDTIDFVVGRGLDGSGYASGLKIAATLTPVSAPPVAPVITAQPQNQAVRVGETAQFSVTATGTEPLSYQWWFEGSALAGQTGSTLTLANVQPAQAGNYWVVVANAAGAVTSQVARLTVEPPPLRRYDLSADFSLSANPAGVWSYGWKSTLDGAFSLLGAFRVFRSDNGVPIAAWEPATYELPVVAKVLGPGTAISIPGHFHAPAGTVYFAPGFDGSPKNFGVIRFTVPVGGTGTYRLETAVQSLFDSVRSQDADFHVVHNGLELFGRDLPPNSSAAYTNTLVLQEGDTVDFVVGRGPDGLTLDTGLKIGAGLTQVPGPANHAPVAFSQSVTVPANTPAALTLQATDADGDALTFRVAAPIHGTLSGTAPDLVYTPAADYFGSDSFTFQASDGQALSEPATVRVTVLGPNGTLSRALADLEALRGIVDNKALNKAIGHLTEALDPELWLDEAHLAGKHGHRVFADAQEAVKQLENLLKAKKGQVAEEELAKALDLIVKATRLLATVALHEGSDAGETALAKGDADAAKGRFASAISRYRTAWQQASRPKAKILPALAQGAVVIEIIGHPGADYEVQASTDLIQWGTVGKATATPDGKVRFSDADAPRHPARFYRLVER